ncbi:MAG: hypothetical protein R3E10_02915 [Gemmatimonadota bacterium]
MSRSIRWWAVALIGVSLSGCDITFQEVSLARGASATVAVTYSDSLGTERSELEVFYRPPIDVDRVSLRVGDPTFEVGARRVLLSVLKDVAGIGYGAQSPDGPTPDDIRTPLRVRAPVVRQGDTVQGYLPALRQRSTDPAITPTGDLSVGWGTTPGPAGTDGVSWRLQIEPLQPDTGSGGQETLVWSGTGEPTVPLVIPAAQLPPGRPWSVNLRFDERSSGGTTAGVLSLAAQSQLWWVVP